MREYKTQMEAARKGIVTEELKKVAQKEHLRVEELMPLVAAGKVAICANKNHKCLDPQGVGSMLRTKINVNLGVSRDWKDYDIEMQKVMAAVDMGADAIMDLSSHGDTTGFRRKLTSECPAMIGTVPVYDSVIHYQRDLATLTAKDFIDVVRLHAEDGVDFVTLHCGITRKTIDQIKNHKRKMNIVSRGGSLVFAWMTMTGEENPFYEYYDEILDICREYDVTISLGDACRPGCLADASDVCQIEELVRLGELTKRAWEKDVQVMVEGPGHMPMDQIAANMKIQQTICMGAPFYVLGPLVTDIAPGYDHITSAIGGAIAAANGAAFLCYVTPAEHLALPNVDDVKQGIMASKIAAHAADIAKHVPGAMEMDSHRMQFTPDVLPADILGFSMYEKAQGAFVYQPGAIMCNLFLADEINRTSPKTQSALLEVMEEGNVTVDGVTRRVPEPFVVIATENPVGSVGTQLLPESQLDRFMICMTMGYPDAENEIAIAKGRSNGIQLDDVQGVIPAQELILIRAEVENIYLHDEIYSYIVDLARATREHSLVELGMSPRGTIALAKMAKAAAFLSDRDFVVPNDVTEVFSAVVAHRLVLNSKARVGHVSTDTVLEQILSSVQKPKVRK